ncbi:hypothetical protein ACFJIV_02090 [Mucilaginibacter sp. UC70_90]
MERNEDNNPPALTDTNFIDQKNSATGTLPGAGKREKGHPCP